MACRLVGAKPLSEPMLEYCYLDPWEQTSVKSYRNLNIFIQENACENVVWKMAAILSRPQCVKPPLIWHHSWTNGCNLSSVPLSHLINYTARGVPIFIYADTFCSDAGIFRDACRVCNVYYILWQLSIYIYCTLWKLYICGYVWLLRRISVYQEDK